MFWESPGDLLQQFQPAHARHLEVGNHDGGRPTGDFLQAFDPVLAVSAL